MYIMTITRNGISQRILASGWTPAECGWAKEGYESLGYTVTFGYGVWC